MTSVSNSEIALRYHLLPQNNNNVILRYIWLDGNGYDLRTKSIHQDFQPKSVDEVPLWCYCGQTCGHMKLTANSDCWLKPVLLCNDPFRAHNHKLVFCVPIHYQIEASINRHSCEKTFNELNETKDLSFSIRQPYILIDNKTRRPMGWPNVGYTAPKGPFYCGIGSNKANGRDINEAFYKACLYAGLPISSTQASDLPSVWTFEIGPTRGVSVADQLWMARYILHYIGEEFNVWVSFKPNPLPDVVLGHDLDVSYESYWITSKETESLVQSQQDLSNSVSQDGINNKIHKLFASHSDPYVAIENIIKNLIQ